MAQKSDGEQVSVILPRAVKRWVRKQATEESITLAAWIRRLVVQAKRAA
jgi:hypothetical protein